MEADVISFLQNNPGKDTATDIVELRRLSKGAVSKAVEGLIQKSLLERIPDMEDRRRIHLKLKTEAKPVITMINEVREDFYSVVFRGITEEELETVLNPYLMTEIGEDRKNGKMRRKIG